MVCLHYTGGAAELFGNALMTGREGSNSNTSKKDYNGKVDKWSRAS